MKKTNLFKTVLIALVFLFAGVTQAQVIVVATAGNPGPMPYATLNAAFAAINAGTHQGSIAIAILSNTTETGPCVLNASGAGPAVYTAVAIGPGNDAVTVAGPTTTGRGLIELNGADNVTIDGDNPNTAGTNRNLTIQNTAANSVARTSCIRLATSTLITNCDNVIIRNCNVSGSGTGRNASGIINETITWGIVASGLASTTSNTNAPGNLTAGNTMALGQTVTNLLINNNSVQNVSRGIAVNGADPSVAVGLVISSNTVGNVTAGAPDQVWALGIAVQGSSNGIISGNIVYVEGFIQSATLTRGIEIGTVSANGTFTIERNEVRRVMNNDPTAWPAVGINVLGGTNQMIRNNFITGISNNQVSGFGAFSETYGAYGIRLAGGTGHNVIYNTVHLTGAIPGTMSTNITACMLVTTTSATGCSIRNNIFSNQMTGGDLTGQNVRHTALLLPSGATSSMNLTINNNRYYQGATTSSTIAQVGFVSGSSTDYFAANFNAALTTPAANLRAYTSTLSAAGTNDNASGASTLAPPLTSATNLHANLAAPNLSDIDAAAAVIAGTTNDFDNDPRDPATPDIGGDEFISANCVAANGGTISPSTVTTCANQVITMTSTGATLGAGITYQWMVSTTSGGPYVNVTGGSGANTTSYTTGALSAGTFYYVLQTTCSFGPLTGLSNQVTVTVNSIPTVAVSPTSATYCSGAPAISLAASGALTYAWTPVTGLSSGTGANVTASPAGSTMYTVVGMDANGCFNSATTTISVAPTPTVTVTTTPSTVCSGGNSQLLATVASPVYYATPIPYAPTVGAGTPATTGDDAMSGAVTIPFTFNFYGVGYTQLFVCTNGFIQLGTNSATTNVYGQALPAAAAPNNIIAGVYSDLNSPTAGQIVTYVTGVSPNRILTVYYNNVPFYSNAASPFTTGNTNFQIQLFETSNIVEIHVGNVTGASTTTANKTLGIENAAGTEALTGTGRNFVNWTTTGEAWRFTPTAPFTYGWTPSTFLTATNIANPMAQNVTATTTYSATVTSTSGCSAMGSATLTAGAVLSSTSGVTPSNTVCEGTTVTFSGTPTGGGAPYTYSWAGPNSFSSTSQNPTLLTTPAASGIYTLTITDACASTSVTTVPLTVNTLPVVTVSPSTATYCSGSPAIALTASGAPSFTWGPADGLSSTTGANVSSTPPSSLTYTVTGTDGNGCVNTATTAITWAPGVTGVVASSSATAICAGDSIDLSSTVTNPITVISQDFSSIGAWTTVNAPSAPVATNWASVASPFSYVIGSLNFSNFSTPNGGNFYMTNSDAGGSGSTTNTQLISPVFSTMGMTTASLSFEQLYQRWASGDVTVAVEISTDGGATWSTLQAYTSDQGTVTAAAQVATTTTINLSAYLNQPNLRLRYNYVAVWGYYWILDNIVVSGNMTNTFAWTSTPSGFASALQNPADVVPAATTDYHVTVTNALGCSTSDTVNVVVNPLPTVVANATATAICDGNPVTLTGSGATSYTWTGSVTDNVAFNPSTTDTYTVTGTDANGCVNTDNITVTVNALPTVVANATATTLCDGDAVTLTGSGATSYTWAAAMSVTDNVAFNPSATDTYTVTGTDGNGCMNTDMITVTVNPLPTVVANSTASAVCAGMPVTVSGSGATSYTWAAAMAVTDNVAFTPTATDTYTVTGTDANGCMNTDMVTVTVNALPVVTLTGNTSFCAGDSTQLSGTPNTMNQWYMNGMPVSGATAGSYYATAAGVYNMTEMDANGCMDSSAVGITINVNALPSVTATATDSSVCAGSQVTFTGGGAASYTWTGGVVDATPFTVTVTDTYTVTGTDANGCMNTASVMVTANALPTVTASIPQSSVCVDDGNLTLTGESPAGGVWSGTNVTGSTFDPTTVGNVTITYTYTDVNGCTNSASDVIAVNACTGIDPVAVTVTDVTIYPNPNEGQFTIQLPAVPASSVQVEVMNELGQVVDAFTMTATTKEVNISTLESGVYFVRVINEGKVSVHRVVKQ